MTSTGSWAEYKKPLGLSLGITALVWILLFTIVIFDPSTHSAALLPSTKADNRAPTQQACPFTPCADARLAHRGPGVDHANEVCDHWDTVKRCSLQGAWEHKDIYHTPCRE